MTVIPPKTESQAELVELTSLRFFAALHVVLFHNLYLLGDVSVSLFFILSGFILSYVYCTREGSLRSSRRRFWLARFARIYRRS